MFLNGKRTLKEKNPIFNPSQKDAIMNRIRFKFFDSDFSLEFQDFLKKNLPSRFFSKIRRLKLDLNLKCSKSLKRNALQKMRNVEIITINTDQFLKTRIYKNSLKFNLAKSILKSITKLPNLSTLVLKCIPDVFEESYERLISKFFYNITFPVKFFSGVKSLKIFDSSIGCFPKDGHIFKKLIRLKAYSYKNQSVMDCNVFNPLDLTLGLKKFPNFKNLEKFSVAMQPNNSIVHATKKLFTKLKKLGQIPFDSDFNYHYSLDHQLSNLKIYLNEIKLQSVLCYLRNFRQLTCITVSTTSLDRIWRLLSLRRLTSLKIYYLTSISLESKALACLNQLQNLSLDPKNLNLEKIYFISSETRVEDSHKGIGAFFKYFSAIPSMKKIRLNEFKCSNLYYIINKPIFILGDRLLDQSNTMVLIFEKNQMKNFSKLKYLRSIHHLYPKIETLRLTYEDFAGTNQDYKDYYSIICNLKNLKTLEIFINKSESSLRDSFVPLFQQVRSLEKLSNLKLKILDYSLNQENFIDNFSKFKRIRNLKNFDIYIERKCMDKICMMALLDVIGTLSNLNQLGLNVVYADNKIILNKLIETLQSLPNLEEVRLILDIVDNDSDLNDLEKFVQENQKVKIDYSIILNQPKSNKNLDENQLIFRNFFSIPTTTLNDMILSNL